jgi:fused signal recognition particle receptor
LEQAKHFTAATDVTAMIITKLDGTAKGGVVLAIANQFNIPVKYIGVGEKITDLIVFDKHEFVDSLFSLENKSTQSFISKKIFEKKARLFLTTIE